MKKLSKLIALGLTLALTASVIGGCATKPADANPADAQASPASEKPVEITFWTQDAQVWAQWFEAAITDYNASQTKIKVNAEYFPSFADKMTQAYAAGQQPDVAQTWQGVAHWAKAGKISEVPASLNLKENYFEGALMSKMYDGKYYGVPSEINIESPSLYVNMDLLAANNVEIPASWIENNGPATWQELVDFAKPLTIIDNGLVTQSGLAYVYAQWEAMFVSLIWQYGGDYRDPENEVVHFDTPEARKALEFMLKYSNPADPDCISDNGNSRADAFIQGTAAMCIGAPWYAGMFGTDAPDMNYQVFNLPAFVEGSDPYCLATGGWGYVVSETSPNKEAAWEFVNYINNPENNGKWAKSLGTLSARKDAVMDLAYDKNKGSVEKALSTSGEVLQYGKEDGAYTLDPSTLIYNIIRLQLQQALENGDIDTALKTMEQQGNLMIKENLGRE